LTVDLSSTIGTAKHVASGSLYGVTETLPADVTGLIAPLHPNMFTNPAVAGSGKQQPVGGAIAVAVRIASTGGTVTLRLADWFPGWPYAFTNMTDWLDKVTQTYTSKQASGVTNYYGYEIWNEPDGTWTNSLAFTEFWRQTYVKIRALDPTAKIIGPSISYFSSSYLNTFLTYAKANNCVPDIISWHELSGGNLTSNFTTYRSLETQLGIGPLPISINEYSGPNHIDDEGKPGASAPMIAKFERFKIDSASITFWDVAHPGRLGSLLATNTATNGGWWFYKWYGDMSGNMVTTTPPSPNTPSALDGFANLDTTGAKASVLFGGVNDGTIQIVVKGFSSASFFGSSVHAVVEHTPFANRTTVVTATDTVSTADVAVANSQITVTVSGANNNDGYRLNITPVAGSTGGTSGAGGSPNTGGSRATGGTVAVSTGGSPSTGGSRATGGTVAVNTGGSPSTGGSRTTGGTVAVNTGGSRATGGTLAVSTGGSPSIGTGGSLAGVGGSNNTTGGVVAAGGSLIGTGGNNQTGGMLSAGGILAAGGARSTGGMVGSAGSENSSAGTTSDNQTSSDTGSCSCRVAGEHANSKSLSLALLGAFGILLRSRKRTSAVGVQRRNRQHYGGTCKHGQDAIALGEEHPSPVARAKGGGSRADGE
jgi:MYXO-CTERM domain-containing protein